MKFYQTTVEPSPGQGLTKQQHKDLTHGFDISEKDPRHYLLSRYCVNRSNVNRWFGGPEWVIDGIRYQHYIEVINT